MSSTSSAMNPLTTSSGQMGGRGRRSRKMAKGSMRASRSASRSMALAGGRRRKRRGGAASGAEYVASVLGTEDQQYKNVFESPVNNSGNAIVGLAGQQSVRPVQTQLGGKRRTKRGGYWGQVLSTALVPFGLWAAQNRFSKRRGVKHGGKTRKHR